MLGEDNELVLCQEMGLSPSEMVTLRESRVI